MKVPPLAAIPHNLKKLKYENSVHILSDFLKSLENKSKQQYTLTGWNLTQSSLSHPHNGRINLLSIFL